MKELCELAGVSRSGYYKWRRRDGAPSDARREKALRLVRECHEAHPSHGYRWVHAYISQHEEGFCASADYVRRCFGYLGISSETKHKPGSRSPKREVKDPYPNLIFSTWETVDAYVTWYNSERPCWALGYMTPDAFYGAFMAGDVERKDTFKDRVLDPTPKFVREKLAAAEEAAESNGGIGSSDPVLFDRRVHDAA